MTSEQIILMMFIPIGGLIGAILTSETQYMIGIDNYIERLSNKHGRVIDKSDYCRFEGMQRIIGNTYLMIGILICAIFEAESNSIILMLLIWGIFEVIRNHIKKKKYINKLPIIAMDKE